MTDPHSAIVGWESFYVIVGSSAAALTGLQFVVIALGADRRRLGGSEALHAFGTPTVVHFCAVLLLAALLTTPKHTLASLSGSLSIVGLAGLLYGARVLIKARRQSGYQPVLEDWIWHTVLPWIAYAVLFASGIVAARRPEAALYGVAVSALMLLYVGIHNAWDAAVWLALEAQERPAEGEAGPAPAPPRAPAPATSAATSLNAERPRAGVREGAGEPTTATARPERLPGS